MWMLWGRRRREIDFGEGISSRRMDEWVGRWIEAAFGFGWGEVYYSYRMV
jgi:hypothetical protein